MFTYLLIFIYSTTLSKHIYLKSKYLYDYLLKYINYFFIFNFNKSGIDTIALNIMISYKLITPATI